MKYVINQGVLDSKNTVNMILMGVTALILTIAMSLGVVLGASAHGGPGTPASTVDPADKNCMGQLAKLHAQDPQSSKGLAGSLENRHHSGFIGDANNDETVGEEMKAFKAYCRGETE